MIRPLTTSLGIALLAMPAAAAIDALPLVKSHLGAVDTMTADFEQIDREGKRVRGVLTLKKPGKIRFQYEKGVPILIVGDGKALYFLDYQVRQKQRWPIGESPLGILLNPARDPSKFARVLPTGDSRVIRVEAYDPKHPEYGRIDMIFARDAAAPGGLRLQGWVALDAQNNRTTIRLSNTRFNVPVSDNTFRWRDPTSRTRPN